MTREPDSPPPVSVIVPVKDRLDLLRAVIEGFVAEHARSDFELLIVDDGSNPPVQALLDEIGRPAFATLVRHESNRGRGAALNTGLRHARAEIVVFCDADIVPAAGFIAGHLRFHTEHPSELATYLGKLEHAGEVDLFARLMGARANPKLNAYAGPVDWTLWYTDNWSFKRRLFTAHALAFDESFRRWGFEELELAHRLAALGATNELGGTALGRHLKAPDFDRLLASFARSAPNLVHLARVLGPDPRVAEWLANRCASRPALEASEDFLRATWRRIEELDRGLPNGLTHESAAPIATWLACAVSDAIFTLGIARGLEEEVEPGAIAALELPSPDDLRVPVGLARVGTLTYFTGALTGAGDLSFEILQHTASEMIARADASGMLGQRFWETSEHHLNELVAAQDTVSAPATRERAGEGLLLSVVVPTWGRPERVLELLALLDRQTLAPECFEVIVVDDGSPEPVRVSPERHAYALTLVRQANAGPGAARNHGVKQCRAPLVLFLNDDALPEERVCALHVQAHADAGVGVAVMGSFPFTERALRHPFVQVLADSDLLFDFTHLVDGARLDWHFFWTCNISLTVEDFRAVGGFDPRFRDAIVEDVELGYRLEKERGLAVLYRAQIRCEHDHELSCDAYLRRAERLGVNVALMWEKHRDPAVLWCAPGFDVEREQMARMQASCEVHGPTLPRFREQMATFEAAYRNSRVPPEVLAQVRRLARTFSFVPFAGAVLNRVEGHDPRVVVRDGPPRSELVSIIVVTHEALGQTRRCLESLRRAADPNHPQELIFVDNGSRTGTAEYLAVQPDLELVRNAENRGAPAARNQGLVHARGRWIVFLDNDVVVTPGWLTRLLYHAAVDGRSGCVSSLADRAAHGQQIELTTERDPTSLATFADRLALESRRSFRRAVLLSSFLLLVRREVITEIGGFDERFTPWGFEDDDFTLRAHLAGFRNRVALDVFVHHEGYGGAKAERHNALLLENWRRFAAKWELALGTPYGEMSALEASQRRWRKDELHVPIEIPEAAGALEASSCGRA